MRNRHSRKPMHYISVFSSLFASLFLASCVSATAQQLALDSTPGDHGVTHSDSCNVENIVHNMQDDGAADSSGLDPDSISVLNWNVYKGQRKNWATDFRRYSHKHDVVIIQEAHLRNDLKSLLGSDNRHWVMNASFQYQDKATGVMTASSVKPVYSCGMRTLEPLIRLPKTSLISLYPVDGMHEKLLVANIHGINFTLGVDVYKEQIEKLYAVINRHSGPVVLAGDFNSWSAERMQIVEDLAQRLSLQSLDYTSHNRTRIFGNVLDHVFYRGLEPLEYDTWHVASSDHNPMRVRFRLSRTPVANGGLAVRELNEENS